MAFQERRLIIRLRLPKFALVIVTVVGSMSLAAPLNEATAQVAVASAALDGAAPAPPTFYGDILPILQVSCQSCHRPGEVAPMSLLTYDDAGNNLTAVARPRQTPATVERPERSAAQAAVISSSNTRFN